MYLVFNLSNDNPLSPPNIRVKSSTTTSSSTSTTDTWINEDNFAIVQLIDIPTVYISPGIGKFVSRLEHMRELTKRVGFLNVTHYQSGTEAYPKCLVRAVIDLLQQHLDTGPFLLLEDDVEWHGQNILRIPLDADAVYLGVSGNAGHVKKNKRDGPAKFEPYNDDWKRVLNMLSGHAILFISRGYMEHVISILEPLLSLPPQHKDVVMSRTQIGFRIYAPRGKPIFYQSPKFGGQKNTNPK